MCHWICPFQSLIHPPASLQPFLYYRALVVHTSLKIYNTHSWVSLFLSFGYSGPSTMFHIYQSWARESITLIYPWVYNRVHSTWLINFNYPTRLINITDLLCQTYFTQLVYSREFTLYLGKVFILKKVFRQHMPKPLGYVAYIHF